MVGVVVMLWAVVYPESFPGNRPALRSERGSLPALVERFADDIPGPDSGGYEVPAAGDAAAIAQAMKAIQEGRIEDAADLAAPLGYEVVRFEEVPTGRHLILLAEHRESSNEDSRGWGLFVYSPAAASTALIEVPHPVADLASEDVGVRTFLAADAQALLIAGANREADDGGQADVAHRADSVFEAVHRELLGTVPTVLQVHGFDSAAHTRSFGDAVVSSGTAHLTSVADTLAGDLESAGWTVCRYDGKHCRGLGGTTNVQGDSTRALSAEFLHVELGLEPRRDSVTRARVATAIARVLRDSRPGDSG